MDIKKFLEKHLWLIFLGLGFLGFLVIFFLMPHKSEIDSIPQFSFKIFVYVIICLSVSFFPNKNKHLYLFLIAAILGFLLIIMPRIAYMGFFAIPEKGWVAFDEFYTLLYLILFNFVTLLAAFAYRLGKGSPGNTFKIAMLGQIVILSGTYDFMIYIVNGMPIPDMLNYTHHMKIFIGHFPSPVETIIFALCHLPIFLFVLLSPFDKWIKKLGLNIE